MVKIKITKTDYEYEKVYVGNVYEAFKMTHPDGSYDYAAHVDKDFIIQVLPENCEVVEGMTLASVKENTLASMEEKTLESNKKILLVEDGSVDIEELDAWCDQNVIKLVVYRQGSNEPKFLNI